MKLSGGELVFYLITALMVGWCMGMASHKWADTHEISIKILERPAEKIIQE